MISDVVVISSGTYVLSSSTSIILGFALSQSFFKFEQLEKIVGTPTIINYLSLV
jgi:hypothetical protein